MVLMHGALRLQVEVIDLLVRLSWTYKNVSTLKDVPISTLKKWKKHYLKWGEVPAKTRKDKLRLGPRLANRAMTLPVKAALRTIATETPWLYLDEFQEKLNAVTGVLVSTSTIWKVLTRELRWSLQIAQVAARQRNEIDRANHQATLHEITANPKQFVFVDESSKDKASSVRRRVWMPINNNNTISRYFSDGRENSYTLVAAADMDGFIPEACELIKRKRSTDDADEEAGTVDAERFVAWVQYKLVPTLGRYQFDEPRSIVVMDNASIHMDIRVNQLIMAAGSLLIYQAAYSPDLDPIEFCFHQYKAHLKRNQWLYKNDQFLAHFRALGAVSPANMRAYYRKVGGIQNIPEEVGEDVVMDGGMRALMILAAITVCNNNQ